MANIAGTYGGKCVERGISTMRLALGYKEGLPSLWPCPCPIKEYQLLNMFPVAFPRHRIRVWHSGKGFFRGVSSPCSYMGEDYITTEESDNWLTAFVYGEGTLGHFVIGEPVTYGDQATLIVSVSLKEST